jgi:hypothetical protein
MRMLRNEMLLSPLFFKIVLEDAIRKVQEKHGGLELNWTQQIFLCADVVYWVEA